MMELSYAPSPRLIDPLARVQAALAGRYTIERELGRGGMATVYLAQDRKHHRPVAIKVLKPELAAALGPERFLREIDTAARLTHPHILPLHDSGEAAGLLYYVMPYVEGETLRDRLEREGRPLRGRARRASCASTSPRRRRGSARCARQSRLRLRKRSCGRSPRHPPTASPPPPTSWRPSQRRRSACATRDAERPGSQPGPGSRRPCLQRRPGSSYCPGRTVHGPWRALPDTRSAGS